MEALRLHCGERQGPIGRINAPSLAYFHQDAVANTYAYLTPTLSLHSYAGSSSSFPFILQCSQITALQLHLHHIPSDMGRAILQTVQSLTPIPYRGLPHDPILHLVRQVDFPSLTAIFASPCRNQPSQQPRRAADTAGWSGFLRPRSRRSRTSFPFGRLWIPRR
jgi:hypothetical protein